MVPTAVSTPAWALGPSSSAVAGDFKIYNLLEFLDN